MNTDSYLVKMIEAIRKSAAEIPAMQAPAEMAAKKLYDGGKLHVSGNPGIISELTGRAGGIMMLRRLDETKLADGDVILSFPETSEDKSQLSSAKRIFTVTFGGKTPGSDNPSFQDCSASTGISQSLAACILGWLFTGELISALTRLGKMPVIFESYGGYDGKERVIKYKRGEPPFHEDLTVKAISPGVIAVKYAETVCGMLRRAEKEQRNSLDTAGQWCRQAIHEGKIPYMYSMGHIVPVEVKRSEITSIFKTKTWQTGFSHIAAPDDKYTKDDLTIHIGYQHPPRILIDRSIAAGAKNVYVCVRTERDYVSDSRVLWIDPMWDWLDACVPVEGYDVPVLPASGLINTAIAWEIFRLSKLQYRS